MTGQWVQRELDSSPGSDDYEAASYALLGFLVAACLLVFLTQTCLNILASSRNLRAALAGVLRSPYAFFLNNHSVRSMWRSGGLCGRAVAVVGLWCGRARRLNAACAHVVPVMPCGNGLQ